MKLAIPALFFLTLLLLGCLEAALPAAPAESAAPAGAGQAELPAEPVAEKAPEPALPEFDPEAENNARELAQNYVKSMIDYKEFEGRNLKVTKMLQGACPGCWLVELQFDCISAEDPEKKALARVTMAVQDWNVVDVNYSRTEP